MSVDFLAKVFREHARKDAVLWNGRAYSYGWLLRRIAHWRAFLEDRAVRPGSVAVLEADFSPNSLALFLALADRACILVPLTDPSADRARECAAVAQAEVVLRVDRRDRVRLSRTRVSADHPLYAGLRAAGRPGIVLFSSGSTGTSKAAVHDLTRILEKFKKRRRGLRTVAFLLFDHLGGLDTWLYALSNAGTLISVRERSPDGVLRAVERHSAELLPASPTFLNLLLLSEAFKRYDLRSLTRVAYGAEPMPQAVLTRLRALLPGAAFLQTYGLTEAGVLRSRSESSDSLWVEVRGEGVETRVRGGLLQIKSRSMMLGYLNAPSPFTKDGWLDTRDRVEKKGRLLRILGRDSEVINVGGEKVHPAEVEDVILALDNVAEAVVYAEKSPLVGSLVCARVRLKRGEAAAPFSRRLKKHCAARLERYKVPVKILLVDEGLASPRFKKKRTPA